MMKCYIAGTFVFNFNNTTIFIALRLWMLLVAHLEIDIA